MISGRLAEVQASPSTDEWTFIVGTSFIVGIFAPHEIDALSSFDQLRARTDARVEELVAALPEADAEGSFAIIAEVTVTGDEAGITVVVRGEAAVDIFSIGGWRRFTDRGIRPWLLADFGATTAIAIGRATDQPHDIGQLEEIARPDASKVFQAGRLAWTVRGDHETATGAPKSEDAPDQTVSRTGPGRASTSGTVNEDTVRVPGPRISPWTPPPVPDSPPARPVSSEVYRFRVGDQEVWLTDIAYVGRNPRPPRIKPANACRLVTVDSATRGVSSTHLKVEQVGNTVVVTDLASANGTIVTSPGAAPVRLRRAESLVVSPGTQVDIGDGNIVEILTVVSGAGTHAAGSPEGAGQ